MIDPLDPGTFELKLPAQPMSNAERQRRHRQMLKEKRESEGLRAISLTSTERCVLSLGLLAHEDLDHRGPNWVNDKKPGFDALLRKLWPEGDRGRYLAEPRRSTYRPAASLRGNLQRVEDQLRRTDEAWRADRDKLSEREEENRRLKAGLVEIAAELGGAPVAVPPPAVDVAALQAEVARLRAQLERQHIENLNTTAELGRAATVTQAMQNRLKEAGLPHDYRQYLG